MFYENMFTTIDFTEDDSMIQYKSIFEVALFGLHILVANKDIF